MKFEEVLPLLKQGRIATHGEHRYQIRNNMLQKKLADGWHSTCMGWVLLGSENWEIEKAKVKKCQWVFGKGHGLNIATSIYHTEESAEKNRIQRGYEWKHPIPQTEIEVEED